MSTEWEMPRPGETCAACRCELAAGDAIQAYLFASPEGYERRDYCARCRPPDEPFAIGSWQTQRRPPASKSAQTFDREAIRRFFERLENADTPEKLRLRFVLALLLWRKKVLKFERSVTDAGQEIWHFASVPDGATHEVLRPDLDEGLLERLEAQLATLLAGGPSESSVTVASPDEEHGDD